MPLVDLVLYVTAPDAEDITEPETLTARLEVEVVQRLVVMEPTSIRHDVNPIRQIGIHIFDWATESIQRGRPEQMEHTEATNDVVDVGAMEKGKRDGGWGWGRLGRGVWSLLGSGMGVGGGVWWGEVVHIMRQKSMIPATMILRILSRTMTIHSTIYLATVFLTQFVRPTTVP